MIGIAFSFLSSRLGGYAVAGLTAAVLGGVIYVRGLQLDAARADLDVRTFERDVALQANDRFRETVERLTEDAATAKRLADAAAADVASAKARVQVRTVTITKEVTRAATIEDDQPVTPGLRAALAGLRQFTDPGR